MYVCICNGLNDRDIDTAAAEAETVAQVYRCLGCRPQCGKCVPLVLRLLRGRADGPGAKDAPALLAAE
jgi:bacterioferritin-associated ferredoxin